MSSPEPLHSNVVAVIHRQGDQWACLAGLLLEAGRIRLVNATRLDSEEAIQAWLHEVKAETVRAVLPASEIICRTCSLPDGDQDSLEEALRLQAETQLLGTAPPHRLAVAVLPSSGSDTVRTGLILAWPESSPWSAPALEPTPLYVPDVAALASLLGESRPSEPLAWIDTDQDSLALAITHLQGIQIRALREEFPPGNTRSIVSTAITEMGLQADLQMERLEAMGDSIATRLRDSRQQLLLPQATWNEASNRVETTDPIDVEWLNSYGIALGSLLATSDELVSLTMLQQELPQVQPTLLESTTQQLSSTRIAAWLLTASVLLLIFAPMIISGTRLALLKIMHPSLDYQVQQSQRQDRQYAMYRAIGQESWPMTKLLADISNSTPQGIEVEQIRLGHGEPLKISGMAKPLDNDIPPAKLVAEMKDQLESMSVFDDVVLHWDDAETFGPRTFSIDARVARPMYRPRYEEGRDFGAMTLASRLYGSGSTTAASPGNEPATSVASRADETTPGSIPEGAVAQAPDAGSDSSSGSSTRRPSSNRRPSGSGSGNGATRSDSDSRGGNSASTNTGMLPEMLTTEQIDAMSASEIRQQLVKVSQARKNSRNEETKKELTDQFNLLMDGLKAKNNP